MKVFVIGSNGIGLMPTTPRKARILLKSGKATVVQKNPFTIRLNYKTGSATQDVSLGIDTGEQHIGIAVTSGNTVLYKGEVELRKSMEKRVLMEKRKAFRNLRRYRKVRYRHPKFRFVRKRVYSEKADRKGRHWHTAENNIMTNRHEGWLPPSIQSKINHHIGWITKFQKTLPLRTRTVIEVARFDIQRMQNPEIHGELYQRGRMYGFENKKAYVLAKFGYTCPICKHKFDNEHKARLHHVGYKSKGATDNPDEYAPICDKCHTNGNHEKGEVLDKLRRDCKRKEYREPTFMNILRRRMYAAFPNAGFTYGNVTNTDRKVLNLPKTHANDAVAVSLMGMGISSVRDLDKTCYFKQVRRKKRSLHEANPRKGRSEPNRTAKRNNKNVKSAGGFSLYDTVCFGNTRGYITGFSNGSSAYVVNFKGEYVFPTGQKYPKVQLSKLKTVSKRTNNYILAET